MSRINIYNLQRCSCIELEPEGLRHTQKRQRPLAAQIVHHYEVPKFMATRIYKYLQRLRWREGHSAIWELILDLPYANKWLTIAALSK